jgi:hypothetical protein
VSSPHDCGCDDGRVHRRRFLQLGTGTALGAVLLGAGAGSASASPPRPRFGARIDPYAAYDGQDTCDPTPKPGTVDLKDMLLRAYPGTEDWGIARDCSSGGVSEHKEGRAFDWGVPDRSDELCARDFIVWLFKADKWGNQHAMARRLGIMYIIHNGKMWRSYNPNVGFQPRDCDPNASFDDCHVDHVHFSLSWDGANRKTTWWHPETTFGTADDPYFEAGAAGRVGSNGTLRAPILESC